MDLRRLECFVTVAGAGSFTRAAAALGMAQPPLSQQIKNLEQELGFLLFDRAKRKSPVLTPEGKSFLPEAARLLAQAQSLQDFAKMQKAGEKGLLRVAYISSFQTEKFATILRHFTRKNLGVQVELRLLSTLKQSEAFQLGQVEIGFVRRLKKLPAGYQRLPLTRHVMKLAVPAGHRLSAGKNPIAWADLAEEKMILVDPKIVASDYYAKFFDFCENAGVTPKISQYAIGISEQVWLVAAGQGIAPVPLSDDFKVAGVQIVDLPPEGPQYELDIVWRAKPESPVLEKFVKHAAAAWSLQG